MNIDVKYNIGDNVKYYIINTLDMYETCSFCNGRTEIQGADHTILPCPKCNGRGATRIIRTEEKTGIITDINVYFDSSNMKVPIIMYVVNGSTVAQNDIVGVVNS
jgi:hypothetical protein